MQEAGNDLVDGIRSGRIFDRSGRPYKPSTMGGYEAHLRKYILPQLAYRRLSSITRRDLQALLERLQGEPHNLSGSTIRNVLCPLQVIFGRAVHDERIASTRRLASGCRRRAGSAIGSRARRRRGRCSRHCRTRTGRFGRPRSTPAFAAASCRPLCWRCVDFERRVVRVEKSWDQYVGEIEVKTDAGRRTVPMADSLRRELAAHKLRTGGSDEALVFGRSAAEAFSPSTVNIRARVAWKAAGA
jgi:hypothetical protein